MLGAMLFFAGVVAPIVFQALPADAAGRFLRKLFPRYYDVLFAVSLLAAILLIGHRVSVIMFAVAAMFFLARFWLMPQINRARDKSLSGDNAAKKRFGLLHGASVAINAVQIIAMAIVVVSIS